MFFFVKFAAVTCAFYMGLAALAQAGFLLMARLTGMGGIMVTRSRWLILFGTMWLASFLLSWRIVIAPVFVKLPK